jgi:hypothetical protein
MDPLSQFGPRASLPLAVAISIIFAFAAIAQQTQKGPAAPREPAVPNAAAQPGTQVPPIGVPDDLKLLILIRTTLIALNQANITGDYSILREIGAPGFRQANNPAQLAEIFTDLRSRKIDLSPIAVVEPKLARPAFINDRGMLRITGFFPTKPEQVNFDLAFLPIEGQWRLFGISVKTSQNASHLP